MVGKGVEVMSLSIGEQGRKKERKIRYINKLRNKKDVSGVIKVLQDSDWNVCEYAIDALVEIGDLRAIPALKKATTAASARVQEKAKEALGRIRVKGKKRKTKEEQRQEERKIRYINKLRNKKDIDGLIKELGDSDWGVREYAIDALAEIGDERAVAPLIKALGNKDELVRCRAAYALGEIGDLMVIPALGKAKNDSDARVREKAKEALDKIKSTEAYKEYLRQKEVEKEARRIAKERKSKHDLALKSISEFEDILNKANDVEGVFSSAAEMLTAPKQAFDDGDYERCIRLSEEVRENITEAKLKAEIDATIEATDTTIDGVKGIFKEIEGEIRGSTEPKNEMTKPNIDELMRKKDIGGLIKALGDEDEDVCKLAIITLGQIGEPAIEPLIKALGDKDEDVWASVALGRIGEPAVTPLITALRDKDEMVRAWAAHRLGEIGDKRAVKPLINAIKDKRVGVDAARALGEIGEPAVGHLITALRDKDEDMRLLAAIALGQIGEPAVTPLINVLMDKDENIAVVAVALERIGEPAVMPLIDAFRVGNEDVDVGVIHALRSIGELAVEHLINALGDENVYVRENAARALGEIGNLKAVPALEKAINDSDEDVREKVKEALDKIKSFGAYNDYFGQQELENEMPKPNIEELWENKDIDGLIKALGDEMVWVRRGAVHALGDIGDRRAVESLINTLGDDGAWVRRNAAMALGNIGDPRATEPLINTLGDEDEHVRGNAASALGEIGDPRAVPALEEVVNDYIKFVGNEAKEALDKIKSSDVCKEYLRQKEVEKEMSKPNIDELKGNKDVEGLINALEDSDELVRGNAAGALGRIGDRRAVLPLINALEDSDEYVRKWAATALGDIGDKRAVESLINALEDKDEDVRKWAVYALDRIGDKRAVEPLINALGDKDEDVRVKAASALDSIGDKRAVKSLINALGDENKGVRVMAAGALGSIGDKKAVVPLIKALGDSTNHDLRQQASYALAKIGWDKRAVDPLINALEDSNVHVRRNAAKALAEIGDERAVVPFINALEDSNGYVRMWAAYALGRIGDARAIPALEKATSDTDADVRKYAKIALDEIKSSDGYKEYLRQQELEKETSAFISSLESEITQLKSSGVTLRKAEELIKQAKKVELNKNNFERANDLAKEAKKEANERKAGYDSAFRSIFEAEAILSKTKAKGVIISTELLTKAKQTLNEGNYDAAKIWAEHQKNLVKNRETKHREARQATESANSTIEKIEELGCDSSPAFTVLKEANSAFDNGNYEEAIKYANQSEETAKRIQKESKPEITLKFPEVTFPPNAWKRIDITVTNTGSMHAKDINIKPSGDIEFKRIPTIPQLNRNETKAITPHMKPIVTGDVPIDVAITYRDALNRDYTPPADEISVSVADLTSPPPPPSTQFTTHRTVWDPSSKDFVWDAGRPAEYGELPGIKQWIGDKNPDIYWFLLKIENHADYAVTEWNVTLNTEQALTIIEAHIDEKPVRIVKSDFDTDKNRNICVVAIPPELGVSIPANGVRKMYFKMDIRCEDALKSEFGVSGIVKLGKSPQVEVPIREKRFTYSCKYGDFKKMWYGSIDELASLVLKNKQDSHDREIWKILTNSFRLIRDFEKYCNRRYAASEILIDKLEVVYHSLKAAEPITKDKILPLVEDNQDAMREIGVEAQKERGKRMCEKLVELLHIATSKIG